MNLIKIVKNSLLRRHIFTVENRRENSRDPGQNYTWGSHDVLFFKQQRLKTFGWYSKALRIPLNATLDAWHSPQFSKRGGGGACSISEVKFQRSGSNLGPLEVGGLGSKDLPVMNAFCDWLSETIVISVYDSFFRNYTSSVQISKTSPPQKKIAEMSNVPNILFLTELQY